MSDDTTVLLVYVGDGLGGKVNTMTPSGASYTWHAFTARAYSMSAADAASLREQAPGHFVPAETVAASAKRWSVKGDVLQGLADKGKLVAGTYHRRGEEPQTVILLTDENAETIAAEKGK